MEIVHLLQILLRRRLWVAVGAVLAAFVGAFLLHSAREQTTASASARVLIDASNSPTANLGSEVVGTLAPRASLLADLMTTEAARAATARGAGLDPDQLAVLGPSALAGPTVPVALAVRASEAAREVREPYVLSIEAEPTAPIATLQASAPDAAAAAKLVNAGTKTFESLVARQEPGRADIRLERAGTVTVVPVVAKASRAPALLGSALVFLLWCVAIIVFAGLARHRRPPRGSSALRPMSS